MERILTAVAARFWPELEGMSWQRRIVGTGEVLTLLYSAPLALAGIVWLILSTQLSVIQESWLMLLMLAALMIIFRKLGFFYITEIRAGRYASSDGSMEGMVLWVALLLFGPTTLWLAVLFSTIDFVRSWRHLTSTVDRWNRARNYSFYLATSTLTFLVAFSLYRNWGGEIPLPGLSTQEILPAIGALLAQFILVILIWAGFIAYSIWAQLRLTQTRSARPLIRFLVIALGFPYLAHPFAVISAGLYSEHGLLTFGFLMSGLLVVAAITRQLSWTAESNRQHSRQLERLEELGRAIIDAPPDASTLPVLLQQNVPSMFPPGRVAVWIAPDRLLLKHPEEWDFDITLLWDSVIKQEKISAFLARDPLPWKTVSASHNAILTAPILDVQSSQPLGGVYLEVHTLSQPWDRRSLAQLFPGVLSLAAQVASALNQADFYSQALSYQKVSQELSLAGKIQASFLPDELPKLSGWQLAVTLLPARETSGDFFDLLQLPDGKLGLLIADVADKGVGAALYMALSRTLIRTYAIEFGDDPHPEDVFYAVNERILQDARANLFVTAFYGILDPYTGTMTYCNAGHNPPMLLSSQSEKSIYLLGQTGMPIGVEEEEVWTLETIEIKPGDVLILYTDGIPDALNQDGEFFLDKRLLETASACQNLPAHEIQETILKELQNFVGDAPQFDDITLMVLVRDT